MPERLVVIAASFSEPRRVETRLIQGGVSPETALPLAQAFLEDTLTLGRHTALRADCWLAYDGEAESLPPSTKGVGRIPQQGNDEGERLVHIFREGFDAGFRSVCVIGSHLPNLPVAFIQEAFGRLAFGTEAVFGPTEAGGCYLVGLREMHPQLFTGIPWGTDGVLQHLLIRAERFSRKTALLPTAYNLNTLQDVQRLKRDLRRGVAHAPVTASALAARML